MLLLLLRSCLSFSFLGLSPRRVHTPQKSGGGRTGRRRACDGVVRGGRGGREGEDAVCVNVLGIATLLACFAAGGSLPRRVVIPFHHNQDATYKAQGCGRRMRQERETHLLVLLLPLRPASFPQAKPSYIVVNVCQGVERDSLTQQASKQGRNHSPQPDDAPFFPSARRQTRAHAHPNPSRSDSFLPSSFFSFLPSTPLLCVCTD